MKRLFKKRFAEQSLGTRIALGALLLIAIVTLALVALMARYAQDRTLENWGYQLQERAKLNEDRLLRNIRQMQGYVLFFAKTAPTTGLIRATQNRGVDVRGKSSYDDWEGRIKTNFIAFSEANPIVYQSRIIGIADHGRELVRVDYKNGRAVVTPPDQLQQKGDRDYFLATTKLKQGEVYLSEINLNQEHSKVEIPHVRTIRAAAPLFDDEGKLFGMVILNMDVGPLLDRVTDDAPPGAEVFLANDKGDYLIHPDISRTFGFDLGKRYRWQEDFPGISAAETDNGKGFLLQEAASPGGSRHLAVARVEFDPLQPQRYLTLAYSVPTAIIDAQIAGPRNIAIAGALAAALTVAALFYLYLRRMFAPLDKMAQAAREIGQGQYDRPLPEKASGEIAAFVQAFSQMLGDIRKREEKILTLNDELVKSEKLANQIIDTAPEAILVADTEGRITRANTRIEELFGYTRDELIGQPLETLIPARFRQHHVGLRKNYSAAPSQRQMGAGRELYGLRKDGSEFRVDVGFSPMMLDGKPYVIAALADVTARKVAEEALEESNRQLKRSNTELEQFAYIASHDLQEPLRSIAGPLQLLKKRYAGKLDESAETFIEHAVSGAGRMQQLIDDLLTYSRAGRSEKPFVAVDCNELLEQVVRVLSAAINESGATVTWENLPVINADRTQMFQLFQNLIGNAIKFRGERAPEIRITAVAENHDVWRFTVQDNGIGVPPEHQERVFRIFQRLHTRREYPGTGIGLALCKRIVERHGGKIWLESEPGQGTSFYFQLANSKPAHPENQEESTT